MRTLTILALIVFLCSNLVSQGQISGGQYLREYYSPEAELPVSNVNQIYQTSDGYIWMASFSGLVRFDGVRYKHYTVTNTPSLPSNRLVTIQPGIDNGFWLTTEQCHLLYFENDDFKTFGPFVGAEHQRIIIDGDSITWVIAEYGIGQLSADGMTLFDFPSLEEEEKISAFLRHPDGNIILGSSTGNIYESQYPYSELLKIGSTGGDLIKDLVLDSNRNLWFSNRVVGKFDPGRTTIAANHEKAEQNWSQTPPLHYAIKHGLDGSLIIRSETGLFEVINDTLNVLADRDEVNIISESERLGGAICTCADGSVWSVVDDGVYQDGKLAFKASEKAKSIFCDRENSLWLCLERYGVERFTRSSIHTSIAPFKHNNIYGVYEDSKGRIWSGEWFLHLGYLQGEKFTRLEPVKGMGTTAAFLESSDGRFFIGNKFFEIEQPVPADLRGFKSFEAIDHEVFSIFEDQANTIWFGTLTKLYALKDDHIDSLDFEEGNFPIRFITEDLSGTKWMATNGGGVLSLDVSGKHRYYTKDCGLPSNNIRAVLYDPDGFLWIASEDAGLARLDLKTNAISVVDFSKGLFENGIHTLQIDEVGRLWMSTNAGLCFTHYSELQDCANGKIESIHCTIFNERDGMLNSEANGGFQNASFKGSNGVLLYATQEGVVTVDTRSKLNKDIVLSLAIESFTANGENVQMSDDKYVLAADQTDFQVNFTAPSFIAPDQIQYRYRLNGLQEKWNELGKLNQAVFTNIDGGEYELIVQAYASNSDAHSDELRISVQKKKQITETAAFYIALGLLLISSFYAWFRFRVRSLRRRQETLKKIVKQRTRELEEEKAITEAQKQDLIKRDQEKNLFFTNISHEFRTPLTLIKGPLEELKSDNALNSANQLSLDIALRNTERMRDLVEQLLELSKMQAGVFELQTSDAPIVPYVKECALDFQGIADRKSIDFQVVLPSTSDAIVSFDPDHLNKVFRNVLSNAFKFTPEGGSVRLALDLTDEFVVIRISDSGPGIEPEHLDRLFDRFFQVEKSEMQPGSGIGLSIVKEVVSLHGGNIYVESIVGKGSSFIIELPILSLCQSESTNSLHSSAQKDKVDNDLEEHGLTADLKEVLIVDDNEDITRFLESILNNLYRVRTANSGKEAIRLIKEQLPDLIISDLMMPDGDGFFLLESIRSDRNCDFLPVILLTARSEVEDKLKALGIGADDYLTKPFEAKELKARIKNLLEKQLRLKRFFTAEGRSNEITLTQPEDVLSQDENFVHTVEAYLNDHLDDEMLSVETMADHLNMSRSNFYRKIKDITGETPVQLILRLRIEKAARLISSDAGNMSEIAYSCGFSSLSHFSRSFKKVYGTSPSEHKSRYLET